MRIDGRLVPAAPLADATAPAWPGARSGAGVEARGTRGRRCSPRPWHRWPRPNRTGRQAQRRCPRRRHRRTAHPPDHSPRRPRRGTPRPQDALPTAPAPASSGAGMTLPTTPSAAADAPPSRQSPAPANSAPALPLPGTPAPANTAPAQPLPTTPVPSSVPGPAHGGTNALARHGFRRRCLPRRCRTFRCGSPIARGSPARIRKLTRQARGLPFAPVSSSELAPSTRPAPSLESLSRTAADALRRALAASSFGSVLSTQVEEDLRSALVGLEAIHCPSRGPGRHAARAAAHAAVPRRGRRRRARPGRAHRARGDVDLPPPPAGPGRGAAPHPPRARLGPAARRPRPTRDGEPDCRAAALTSSDRGCPDLVGLRPP